MAGVIPTIEPDLAGGQVVVTRFECPTYRSLLAVLAMHVRLKIDVRRQATGFVGIKLLVQWRIRTILSVSLWQDLDSVYSMGNVPRHVQATRVPRGYGIDTSCGIYCYVGDWRRVMFGGPLHPRSPMRPLEPLPTQDHSAE